jgi:monoamine oxidase
MNEGSKTVLIIGAGLSGLACAKHLRKLHAASEKIDRSSDLHVIIVEGRDRIGGRLLSLESGCDLGAAWSWPAHDSALQALVTELGVSLEPQASEGTTLSQAADGRIGRMGRDIGPAGHGCTRFQGGTSSITTKLLEFLQREVGSKCGSIEIHLNTIVHQVEVHGDDNGGMVRVAGTVSGGASVSFDAHAVVIALPPKLIASAITFTPELRREQRDAMASTPTWMEDTGKAVFTYPARFWLDDGLSGTAFSDRGPMRQVWDSSSSTTAALAGFVFDDDLALLASEAAARAALLPQLVALFGPRAAHPTAVAVKSWRDDPLTAAPAGARRRAPAREFGDAVARQPHGGGRVLFAGTETAAGENGHMNGAVLAGQRAAAEALRALRT